MPKGIYVILYLTHFAAGFPVHTASGPASKGGDDICSEFMLAGLVQKGPSGFMHRPIPCQSLSASIPSERRGNTACATGNKPM